MYLSLIHEGQSQGVKENLPELISKYPNDPGVLYLQALLTSNGMNSLEVYSKLIEKFYGKIIDLDPSNFEATIRLANVLEEKVKVEQLLGLLKA